MSQSISQAKNTIRKALWKLVDKEPSRSELTALWKHFECECAYCGKQLLRGDRKAHIDHLEADRKTGRNHISNRVLACNVCNGDEKREMDWERFLASKCGEDQAAYLIRHGRITEWRDHCAIPPALDEAMAAEVQNSVEACNAVLDREVSRIRGLVLNAQSDTPIR